MSSIGQPNSGQSHLISAHADYRREDYVFARTQSRAMTQRPWSHRTQRLHSWSEVIYPALGVAAAVLAMAEIIH